MRTLSCALVALSMLAAAIDAQAKRRSARHPSPVTNPAYTEGGYAAQVSVEQGGMLELHIATSVSPFNVEIVNLAHPNDVLERRTLTSAPRDCTGDSSSGCDWPVTDVLQIPLHWPSGYYAARFPTSFGMRNIFFIVREDHPGSTSRMVVVASTHTYQAYNSYGNLSTYPSNSPGRSHKVSFDRPYHDNRGLGRFPRWDQPFLEWLGREGRSFEVVSDTDLEDPLMLRRYDVAVLVGHSEYWTLAARNHVEAFVDFGGRLAIFGGNTMWWQARLEENTRTLTVYKDARLDPETGRNDAVVTTNWFLEPVLRPENLIMGASFRNGGYTNRNAPTYSYTITRADHWLLQGSGAFNGQQFGALAAGLEVDGALYNCTMNGLEVDGSDGTPLNFEIVATVPAAEGHGTIGVYTNPSGGAVFNAGTQDWALGLANDPIVQTMTRNVLNRFLSGLQVHTPGPDNAPRLRELFNCPLDATEGKLVPGWRGDEGELAFTQRCASEGPTGLELTGDPRIRITRGFAPTGDLSREATLNFSLNADATSGPASAIVNVVTLQSRRNEVATRAARVELDPAAKAVRLTLFDLSNSTGSRTDWLPLRSGWNPIEVIWRSPGAATLRVNNGAPQTLINPFNSQGVGEVLISYEQVPVSGHLCVDALSIAGN